MSEQSQEQVDSSPSAPIAGAPESREPAANDELPAHRAHTDSVEGAPTDPVGFAAPRHPPTALLGWVALGLAILCVVADVIAISLAVDRVWVTSALIAQALNVCTTIVFFVGLFAVWRRPARWLGLLAMVIAVLANPFILTHLLEFLNG